MNAVIDTNILVSSMLSPNGTPARIVRLAYQDRITPCYDDRILREYRNVLTRTKFRFDPGKITELLEYIVLRGEKVFPPELDIEFIDMDDKKFYEVAKFCNAVIITGNTRHYPREDIILTPGEFLEKYNL